ncbi:MAG: hypothetical protein O3B41_06375 [Bacteroidetes bacterium]|nr:hypothetical protein [Bacteroidota bacterium]
MERLRSPVGERHQAVQHSPVQERIGETVLLAVRLVYQLLAI